VYFPFCSPNGSLIEEKAVTDYLGFDRSLISPKNPNLALMIKDYVPAGLDGSGPREISSAIMQTEFFLF